MIGVCFHSEERPWLQDQWSWLLDNFGIAHVWEIGEQAIIMRPKPTPIRSAAELPDEPRLVVLAPPRGRHVQGQVALRDYQHPESAIYLFGPTHGHLHPDVLAGREHDAVFIPTVGHDEMYTHVAANLVLYDRGMKHG